MRRPTGRKSSTSGEREQVTMQDENREAEKRNIEGYLDMTAYLAIRNIEKEEHMKQFKAGDIIEMETAYTTKEAVIVAVHGTYATVLMLTDNEPRENAFEVRSRAIMYADTGKPGYCFENKIISVIRQMGENEFGELQERLGETLGLYADSDEVTEELKTCEGLPTHTDEQYENLNEKYIKATAEAAVYEHLYKNLLNTVMGQEA